ncbi:hypothetical protein RI543_003453 [Arxiozyma heterogenica]|uniref:glycogenin glucosyltransferase n=1 Tax=Arxiozyma heterogenica TaxID=278026 RepID=A0AAN8A847_9SACH|nr:hypothetical protein RI543_003453 [Kazachstania heterogenica]
MKQGSIAIATLLYSPDYLPGVFTLITQLNKLLSGKNTLAKIETVLFVTPEIYNDALTDLSRSILQHLFTQIIQIKPLRSQNSAEENNRYNLQLLQRPELSFALIKARLWEHTEFAQILYLDADTLPLNDTLFDIFELTSDQTRHQVGAAPDIGWPDLFNSGVMTIVPDQEIADNLQDFILQETSIDGADQGILNQFFNPNCGMTQNNFWLRLPFLYNVTTPNDGYQCTPAMEYFKYQIKLIHFIGKAKPWKAWTMKDFVSNEFSNLWHVIYDEFAESNDITYRYTSIEPESSQFHQEENNNGEWHQQHEEKYDNEEESSNYSDVSQNYDEETCNDEYQNLELYVRPEAIKKMEEKKYEQEQHLSELEEKPPTPVQLPLDFKEWLTTFIEKENIQEPPLEQEIGIEKLTLDSEPYHDEKPINKELHNKELSLIEEDHENIDFQQGNIVDIKDNFDYINKEDTKHQDEESSLQKERLPEHQEEIIKTVPNYKFDWENTNYLQKVERVFPDDVFAYETKEVNSCKLDSDQKITSDIDGTEGKSTVEHSVVLNNEADHVEEDFDDYEYEEEEEDLEESAFEAQKANNEKEIAKSVREKLEELTASIDFGLQDYIDIGTVSDDEKEQSKESKKRVVFSPGAIH